MYQLWIFNTAWGDFQKVGPLITHAQGFDLGTDALPALRRPGASIATSGGGSVGGHTFQALRRHGPDAVAGGVMEKYKSWGDVPDNLKTKKQLGEMGLKPAKDQKPAAIKTGWRRYGPYDLWEVAEAIPKRKLSEAQAAALEVARRKAMTTTCCNRYVGVINWREKGDMCASCWYDWQEKQHGRMLKDAETEASEWARGVLADPMAVILDTETTGLEGRIVDIAIIKMDGKALLDTLINPECPIPPGATAIHGITDEMVQGAPSFADIHKWIKRYTGMASRVIIYNASFDTSILAWDCSRCDLPPLEFKSECAMLWYAEFYGEWSDYWKSFKWQPLHGGDHRALGDCLACLNLIKRMAETTP